MTEIKNNYASVIARVLLPFKKLKNTNTYEGVVALYSNDHDRSKDHRTLIIVRVSTEKNIIKVKNLLRADTIVCSGRILRTKPSGYLASELFSMTSSYTIIADKINHLCYGAEKSFSDEQINKIIIRGEITEKNIYKLGISNLLISLNFPVANDNEYDFGYKRKFIVDFGHLLTENINDNFECGDYVCIVAAFQTIYAHDNTMQRILLRNIKKEPKVRLSIC